MTGAVSRNTVFSLFNFRVSPLGNLDVNKELREGNMAGTGDKFCALCRPLSRDCSSFMSKDLLLISLVAWPTCLERKMSG